MSKKRGRPSLPPDEVVGSRTVVSFEEDVYELILSMSETPDGESMASIVRSFVCGSLDVLHGGPIQGVYRNKFFNRISVGFTEEEARLIAVLATQSGLDVAEAIRVLVGMGVRRYREILEA